MENFSIVMNDIETCARKEEDVMKVSRESPKTHTAMGSSNEKWKEGNEKAVRNVMAAKEAESKAKQKGKKEQKILFRW